MTAREASAPRRRGAPAAEAWWLYGRRTVAEHLARSPRGCRRLLVARGSRPPGEILSLAAAAGLEPEPAERALLDRLAKGPNHQGVCLQVDGWGYADLESLAARARAPGRLPLVVALDSVQDAGNLGAVLRVADGAGAAGVVIPKDRAAGLSPAVARAAAGALANLPVAQVVNLARGLREFKERGFWVLGASGGASASLFSLSPAFPVVVVLGGEHAGLRPNVAAQCDRLASLPMRGSVSSLNVAVAAGIFCYELLRLHAAVSA